MVKQLSRSKRERMFKETVVAQFKVGVSSFEQRATTVLWACSPAEHVKITISGVPNPVNVCKICVAYIYIQGVSKMLG